MKNPVTNEKLFCNLPTAHECTPSPFGTPVHASHPGACASVPRPQVSTGWLVSCPLNALEGVWLFVMCQPSQYLAVWMNQRPTVDCNMVRICWSMIINFLSIRGRCIHLQLQALHMEEMPSSLLWTLHFMICIMVFWSMRMEYLQMYTFAKYFWDVCHT